MPGGEKSEQPSDAGKSEPPDYRHGRHRSCSEANGGGLKQNQKEVGVALHLLAGVETEPVAGCPVGRVAQRNEGVVHRPQVEEAGQEDPSGAADPGGGQRNNQANPPIH